MSYERVFCYDCLIEADDTCMKEKHTMEVQRKESAKDLWTLLYKYEPWVQRDEDLVLLFKVVAIIGTACFLVGVCAGFTWAWVAF